MPDKILRDAVSAARVGGPDNALLVINARIVGKPEVGSPEGPTEIVVRYPTTGARQRQSSGRVRLADLIPPVAEAFLKDQITIGHALLIAKLPATQQQEAFSAAFRG